jgi:hypothetical protein
MILKILSDIFYDILHLLIFGLVLAIINKYSNKKTRHYIGHWIFQGTEKEKIFELHYNGQAKILSKRELRIRHRQENFQINNVNYRI